MDIDDKIKAKMQRLELKEDIFQQQLFLVESKDDSVRYKKRECELGEIFTAAEKSS